MEAGGGKARPAPLPPRPSVLCFALSLFSAPPSKDSLQGRLLVLAGLFLGLYSLALQLSPAARQRSWAVGYRWDHWLAFLAWAGLFAIAHRQSRRYLPEGDPYLLPIGALLSGWGMLTIWRLFPSFGLRQTLWLAIAAGVLVLGLRLPSHLAFLRRYKYLWLTGGLLLTALTLVLGTNPATGSGPRLWLGCCGVYFQPSEPLKLLLVIFLASYLADRQPLFSLDGRAGEGRGRLGLRPSPLLALLAPTLFMTGLTLLLLLAQRDLGTSSIFLFLFAVTVYVATGRALVLLLSAVALLLAGAVGYALFEVVRLRMDAWLNPWLDPSGRSFQIVQSLLAVASGGLPGRGPGLGNPSLVPVPHSDFIFASLAEEHGLAGVIGLVALLALLGARGLRLALRAPDGYRRYLAAGLTAFLIGQSVLIAGGNLRLLPLTGVTLPFVSYGGSSLLTAFLSLLLLLHISQEAEIHPGYTPQAAPYLQLGGFLFASLAAIALGAGWWGLVRGPDLLERTDNPRRAIADRSVRRGSILDRDLNPLAATSGPAGAFERRVLYPPLGPVIGYTHPNYGQSGLEASLDPYLRGLRGNPGLAIWWNHLLYGQPPPGLDLRLSLDLELQRKADQLLGDRPSALVLLNARSGEILAMASHPWFDPNRLDAEWANLVADPGAPLLNRAAQGSYPPGAALGEWLLAAAFARGELPALPSRLDYRLEGQSLECAFSPLEASVGSAVACGCPALQLQLASALGEEQVRQLYAALGLYTAPQVFLPVSHLPQPAAFQEPEQAYLGLAEVSASPLQMALAAATLSAGGVRPAPQLASAVHGPSQSWAILPPEGESERVFPAEAADRAAEALAMEGLPAWRTIAVVPNGPGRRLTWYLAGTLPTWNGAPLALAFLLEEDDPALAEAIGRALLQAAIHSR